MAGSRRERELTEFYCINCGQKGIPVWRERTREAGHRKALYCVHCKMVINHVETRTAEEARQFRQDFEQGLYQQEAAESIEYRKRREKACAL